MIAQLISSIVGGQIAVALHLGDLSSQGCCPVASLTPLDSSICMLTAEASSACLVGVCVAQSGNPFTCNVLASQAELLIHVYSCWYFIRIKHAAHHLDASYSTLSTSLQHCQRFCSWCKENRDCSNANTSAIKWRMCSTVNPASKYDEHNVY